jgi:hypothetical protein
MVISTSTVVGSFGIFGVIVRVRACIIFIRDKFTKKA